MYLDLQPRVVRESETWHGSGRMAQDVIRAINDPYVNSLGVNDTPD